MNKRDVYAEVTDTILDMMAEHGADWIKPWASHTADHGMPRNAVTGNVYHGTNVVLLSAVAAQRGYKSNVWATFKQWQQKGAQVRKGSKAVMGIFFKQQKIEETDANGDKQEKRIPLIRAFNLFNADQVDGYEAVDPSHDYAHWTDEDFHDYAEQWIVNTGADVQHERDGLGDRACYVPALDMINLPSREAFKDSPSYYATAFHELVHWTGHKTRLDRLKTSKQDDYALEELVAEIGAAYQSVLTGVTPEPRADHAKYLNNWMRALRDNKKAFVKATSQAQKAVDYIADLQEADAQESAAA